MPFCLLAARGAAAQAPCLIDIIMPRPVDPVVLRDMTFADGCSLDFGDREVVIAGTVRALDFTLTAGELTVLDTGRLEGGGGVTRIFLRAGRAHSGSADIQGAISNTGFPHGGGIEIEADGDVAVAGLGLLEAKVGDEARGENGGYIAATARGALTTEGRASLIALAGRAGALGGEISLAATSIFLAGAIRVLGGAESPGAVIVTSAKDLTLRNKIQAAGSCADGACALAGVVKLTAGTSLEVLGDIAASGGSGNLLASEGAGGQVMLDAGGALVMKADIFLASGEASRGGTFTARAGGGLVQAGAIDVSGGGRNGDSSGGSIAIRSETGVEIGGTLDASGGVNADAGSVAIVAEEDVSLAGEILAAANFPTGGVEVVSRTGALSVASRIDASGVGLFGTGGVIGLYAVTDIVLAGAALLANGSGEDGLGGTVIADSFTSIAGEGGALFQAQGHPAGGRVGKGGSVDLVACQLLLGGAGDLLASGEEGGRIVLRASDALEVSSAVVAARDGLIEVRHPAGQPPLIEDASFDPEPNLFPSATDPCFVTPACDPVTGLACRAQGDAVHLAWDRAPGQGMIQVLRDGQVIATQGALAESFTDAGVAPGDHAYEVVGLCGSRTSPPVSCSVRVTLGTPFSRGDCNPTRVIDISDPIFLLGFLFQGRPTRLPCPKACDANDDGKTDISDGIRILSLLFLTAGDRLPPPFRTCGLDEMEDALACEEFPGC